ncbi:MAG TPA: hypothetical protein VFT87_03720 [Candidatus Saccharimonadales bacterium]|nr:hypothetical protein [Candidatus Saccharimonadales bacterium]
MKKLTATRVQIILFVLLVLTVAALGVGAWWLQGMLGQSVVAEGRAQIDSQVSSQEVERLQQLQKELAAQQDIVARASQIASTANNYQYQDQVVGDLKSYAQRSGIAIGSFDFGTAQSAAGTQAPAGTTLTPFTVTLLGPIEFTKFMQFLSDIENNLTKIQVSSLTLSPDTKDPKLVANPVLGLVVYLKK